MPTAVPSPLLARLTALAGVAREAGFACICTRRAHGLSAVDVDRPRLTIVLRGRGRFASGATVAELAPGDMLLTTGRCRLDALHMPEPHGDSQSLYLALSVPLCEEVIDAARLLWARPAPVREAGIVRLDSAEFAEDLQRWSAALEDDCYAQARLALAAMVVALCARGHTALLAPAPPGIADEIRRLVGERPERDWRSRDFEAALGLSGATLRRRLTAEGTGLREVIASARLAHALELLYTTRWPLKTVAARVGYRSTASFVRRFAQRYGLDPGRIGNAGGT
ncbi:helix-turn-helix transcriptional regulator [Luteimonas huabeiensis]|uniref:helix-turn-helix transcriptional regulator n=1 Tax=Luteimonas huabeiensis TaxID=1244513 RepID=UPI0004660681|nr:helix-turn-helix transcriptional regulator [Luteimonas huabeiensis]